MREFIAEKERKEFERTIKENREAFMYVLAQRPSELKIGTPSIEGNSASVTLHGSMEPGEEATGSVKMVLEEGKWMVRRGK